MEDRGGVELCGDLGMGCGIANGLWVVGYDE